MNTEIGKHEVEIINDYAGVYYAWSHHFGKQVGPDCNTRKDIVSWCLRHCYTVR